MRSTNNKNFTIEQIICMQGFCGEQMFIETSISRGIKTANKYQCSSMT